MLLSQRLCKSSLNIVYVKYRETIRWFRKGLHLAGLNHTKQQLLLNMANPSKNGCLTLMRHPVLNRRQYMTVYNKTNGQYYVN